jgi:hypothetical protein
MMPVKVYLRHVQTQPIDADIASVPFLEALATSQAIAVWLAANRNREQQTYTKARRPPSILNVDPHPGDY